MRLPNGYGSVYKLSGNRRKPWAARKTTGWTIKDGKSFPVYQFVGFYTTKSEALQALALYNNDPYDLRPANLTLNELYERWSNDHYDNLSMSSINALQSTWKIAQPLYNKKISELKLIHFQTLFNSCGKNAPSLQRLKSILIQMYNYAVRYEIAAKDKMDMISFIEIKAGNPKQIDRSPFTEEEINALWKRTETDISLVLMLIYSGLRAGELTNLKAADVHLDDRWLYVRDSKTSAGIREVPIAEKTAPFFQYWLDKGTEYLLDGFAGSAGYQRFYRNHWQALNLHHRPHDCRHTCISLLVAAGVDSRIVKKIVGHSGDNVTDNVYTHVDLELKRQAINLI